MPLIVPATDPLLEQILDETFSLWGEGLDRPSYGRYNRAQVRTVWGAAHLHRVALVDDSGWLASAKRYDLKARLHGREVRVLGVGAVYTPRHRRRRGHAGELLTELLRGAAAEGFQLALLFSEIGTAYYERFGFRAVPLEQVVIDVVTEKGSGPFSHFRQESEKRGVTPFSRPGPPAIAMRSGDAGDLKAITEINAMQAEGFGFCLLRDADYVAFAHAKKRLLAASGRPGHRETEFLVVEEGGRAAAYAFVLKVGEFWMLTECGDRDPSGARVGALLQSMLMRPGVRPAQVRAWLPPRFLPPQVTVVRREIPPVTMMMAPLGGFDPGMPLAVADVAWWHADAF